jgi:uncharacterized protein (TIGR00299 family) protein
MKILYIDPVFGISGDMMISAFLHAGLPFDELKTLLNKLPVPVPAMSPVKKKQGIIEGVHLDIADSDTHLTIRQMEEIINTVETEEKIKADAKGMLDIILEAESKVHGASRDELHLHELSHIDTLIDLLCVAKGMHYFDIQKVFCGPVPHGSGAIKTSHGIIPNPPPVTLEILSGYNTVFSKEPLELTTPTGATIVRHYVKDKNTAPPLTIEKTGYGMGAYKTAKPDVLRIFIGNTEEPLYDEEIWVIETDIDDMEMEYLGAISDKIRDAGALDVLCFPVYMKKGRIGVRLSVAVIAEKLQQTLDTLFLETTTFGIRLRKDRRRTLKREMQTVETSYGPVKIKKGFDSNGNFVKSHIEFEDVRRLSSEKNIPFRILLDELKHEVKNK